MNILSSLLLPLIIVGILLASLLRKKQPFDLFIEGATEGLKTQLKIIPSILALIIAIEMFKVSGALEMLIQVLSPIAELTGIPREVMPMAILRPVSGGGSIALLSNILQNYGASSRIGIISSVMCGSSETTFYTIAVYFTGCGIKKIRHTLLVSLFADAAAMFFSVLVVNIMA